MGFQDPEEGVGNGRGNLSESLLRELIDALRNPKKGDRTVEVAIAKLEKDIEQHEKDIDSLKKTVYNQHEPVILWCRNFMDSYRKIATAVIISAVITLAGFLVQLYILLHKSNAAK